ncbi:MAG: hypothetical protein GQ570_12130 [Helicobacteraceae bacterium]|nr:hypothetical protein [Helicobacteraceae bacterium]
MKEEDIQNALKLLEAKLRAVPKKEIKQEEPKVLPTRVQYPLPNLGFWTYATEVYGDFEELDIYDRFGMYEIDDSHKRRRKPLAGYSIRMFLDTPTWKAIKAEAKRTKSGWDSRTIQRMIKENANLRVENETLHKLVVDVLTTK